MYKNINTVYKSKMRIYLCKLKFTKYISKTTSKDTFLTCLRYEEA